MPFVFLTAFSDRKDVLDGYEFGVDDYLTKPIDYELLLATVKKSLRQVDRMKGKKEQEYLQLCKAAKSWNTQHRNIEAALAEKRKLTPMKMVLLGEFNRELREFNEFLLSNNCDVSVFLSEDSYWKEIKTIPVHFLLLWNYSYEKKSSLIKEMGEWCRKFIALQLIPESGQNMNGHIPIEEVDHTLCLPTTIPELRQKMNRLTKQKISHH